MFEVKAPTHINRYFAERLSFWDLLLPVQYFGYKGDKTKIPSFYKMMRGTSCFTDLRKDMESIAASMKGNTRNEIRRAIKEGVRFDTTTDCSEFIPFYNEFCQAKGLADRVTSSRLKKFGEILISKASRGDSVLAMHVNVLDAKSRSALLMFSCSRRLDEAADKKLIGWGNRFLHYKDIEYLKAAGFEYYDWSGVCMDPGNPQHTIGQFKLSFGGELTESVTLMTPMFIIFSVLKRFATRHMRKGKWNR